MNIIKSTLLIATASIASNAFARDRTSDIEFQVRTDSPEVTASIAQGKFLIRQREYGLAVNIFRKILRSDPDNAAAYSGMAIAYDGLGRPDLARKNFELALANGPREQKHYRNLARHLSHNGERKLAEKLLLDLKVLQKQKQKQAMIDDMLVPEIATSVELTVPLSEPVILSPSLLAAGPVHASSLALAPLANVLSPIKPVIPSENNVNIADQAILQRRIVAAKVAAGDTGRDAGNLDSGDDEESAGGVLTKPAGAEIAVKKTGMIDLYKVLADVYEGLGNTELAAKNKMAVEVENKPALADVTRSGPTQIPSLDNWLTGLAQQSSKITETRPKFKMVMAPDPDASAHRTRFAGAYLVRQSLGEVLLTTRTTPRPGQRSGQLAAKQDGMDKMAGSMTVNRSDTGRRYFAAVRSILEFQPSYAAQQRSATARALTMKEVDLAMADLKQKRFNRLPRIDRGPSREMQKLAGRLHQYAYVERKQYQLRERNKYMGRAYADFYICGRVIFHSGRQCAA